MNGYDPYKPTITLHEGASINVTAAQLAEGFWSLNSSAMADFFEELDSRSSYMLSMQMAAAVKIMVERAASYDHRGMNAFQTMLSHAKGFHDSAAELRCDDAKRHIAEMARLAKRQVAAR